jgi:hypothetical protein
VVVDDQVRLIDELLSPSGQELLELLAAEPAGAETGLRLGATLRARWPADLVAAALTQRELRELARSKFRLADRMLFTRPGLEQASAEPLARHRACRYQGFEMVADLCTGIGGDLLALAPGRQALAVDTDPVHLRMAAVNAAVYGAGNGVQTVLADAREVALDGVGAVFVDPARRVGDRRLPAGASQPPLAWCLGLAARVAAVGIKAAPGLPLDLVPGGWEAEFVADGRDLREAVLWSPALATAPRRATVLPGGHTLVPEPGPGGHTLLPEPGPGGHTLLPEPGPEVPSALPGAWLLDPNPAVTRAGAVEALARRLGAWKLDPQIAFLSADHEPRSPFGRTLRVHQSMPWNLKRLRQRLRALDVGAVDLRRRGLAGDVDDLRRRLRLEGDRRATVVLTRVLGRPWTLVCTDPGDPPLS